MGPILKIFYDFQNIELVNPEDVLVRAMNFYSEKCIRNRKNKRFPIFIMATLRRQLDFSIVFFLSCYIALHKNTNLCKTLSENFLALLKSEDII